MADPFDSAWLKWGQAVLHAHDLFDQINALHLTEENFCKTTTEYNAKSHCVTLRVVWLADFPPAICLSLGDVVHNYRSCLDHIAWALVRQGATPPPGLSEWEQAGVYFPICSTRDQFDASLVTVRRNGRVVKRAKLPGVAAADIAKVRRYQPYKNPKRKLDLHVFTILEELSNRDKHRQISPIFVVPEEVLVFTWPPQDCEVTRDPPRHSAAKPLQLDTEIHRVYVRKTGPNPRMQMHPQLTVQPCITPRVAVREWLTQTRSYVVQLLREFAAPPLGTLEELGVLDVVTIS